MIAEARKVLQYKGTEKVRSTWVGLAFLAQKR